MILEERTHVDARPEAVFQFFEDMEQWYEHWHPDHRTFRWLSDEGLQPDAEAYFEERIAGKGQRKTVRFTAVEPDRYIEFRPTGWLTRLLLPHISFTIEPDSNGCQVIQRLRVRTGPIGARLNRREFDAVRTHMREEGENLQQLVGSGQASSG